MTYLFVCPVFHPDHYVIMITLNVWCSAVSPKPLKNKPLQEVLQPDLI